MKKYYSLFVFVLLGASFCFSAENLEFNTTLSDAIGVFDKVEVIDATTNATAGGASIGVLTSAEKGFSTNLVVRGKDTHLGNFTLPENTTLGGNAPVWATNRVVLRGSGSVTGKRILTKKLQTTSNLNLSVANKMQMKENASFNDVKIGQKLFVNSRLTYQNNPQLTTEENATWERIDKNTAGDKTAAQVLNFGAQRGCKYACDEVLGSAAWKGDAVCVMNANSCPNTPKGYVSCNTDECYKTTKKNMPCEQVHLYDGGKTGCAGNAQGIAYYTLKEYHNSQLHPNEYSNWDVTQCGDNGCLRWSCSSPGPLPESHCYPQGTPLDNQACSSEGAVDYYTTCDETGSGIMDMENYTCECVRTTKCGSSSNSGRWSCTYSWFYNSNDPWAAQVGCPNTDVDGEPCSDIGATKQVTFPSNEGWTGTDCAVYNCTCR